MQGDLFFSRLPDELLATICSYLTVPHVLELSHAAKSIALDDSRPAVWTVLSKREGLDLRICDKHVSGSSRSTRRRPRASFFASWQRCRVVVLRTSEQAIARASVLFSSGQRTGITADSPRKLARILQPRHGGISIDIDHRHRDPVFEGYTFANLAAYWSCVQCLRMLVDTYSADWTLPDVGGFHALMNAAYYGDMESVAFLLAHPRCTTEVLEARGQYRSEGTFDSATWAERCGHMEVANTIRKAASQKASLRDGSTVRQTAPVVVHGVARDPREVTQEIDTATAAQQATRLRRPVMLSQEEESDCGQSTPYAFPSAIYTARRRRLQHGGDRVLLADGAVQQSRKRISSTTDGTGLPHAYGTRRAAQLQLRATGTASASAEHVHAVHEGLDAASVSVAAAVSFAALASRQWHVREFTTAPSDASMPVFPHNPALDASLCGGNEASQAMPSEVVRNARPQPPPAHTATSAAMSWSPQSSPATAWSILAQDVDILGAGMNIGLYDESAVNDVTLAANVSEVGGVVSFEDMFVVSG